MDIITTFDIWRRALDIYLAQFGLPPLCLADLPAGMDRALRTWYGYGVRAYVLASVLADFQRVTVQGDRMVTGWERR